MEDAIQKYARYILEDLTSLNGFQKQMIGRGSNHGFEIITGELEIESIWPWQDNEYPKHIEFVYKNEEFSWKWFKDSVIKIDSIKKKYKIKEDEQLQNLQLIQEGSQPNSIIHSIEMEYNFKRQLTAGIRGTTKESMIEGIECMIGLSDYNGIKVIPYKKTPVSVMSFFEKKK